MISTHLFPPMAGLVPLLDLEPWLWPVAPSLALGLLPRVWPCPALWTLSCCSPRPCCSKSDDFHTFGPIFLEKGFEREVRFGQLPQNLVGGV